MTGLRPLSELRSEATSAFEYLVSFYLSFQSQFSLDGTHRCYPSETLDDIFEMKKEVCRSIIAAGGDNDFKLPRKKSRNK